MKVMKDSERKRPAQNAKQVTHKANVKSRDENAIQQILRKSVVQHEVAEPGVVATEAGGSEKAEMTGAGGASPMLTETDVAAAPRIVVEDTPPEKVKEKRADELA